MPKDFAFCPEDGGKVLSKAMIRSGYIFIRSLWLHGENGSVEGEGRCEGTRSEPAATIQVGEDVIQLALCSHSSKSGDSTNSASEKKKKREKGVKG